MKRNRDLLLVLLFTLLTAGLYCLPGKYAVKDTAAVRCRAEVMSTDDTEIESYGLIRKGEQQVTMRILDGKFRGREVEGYNELLGRLDRDKIFKTGDEVYLVLTLNSEGEIVYVNPQEHYRLGTELLLFLLFAGLLVAFGGLTGIKALLSFVFAGMLIWKVFIPELLGGAEPVWLALALVAVLCAVIIFLVAGITRLGLTAFLGAFLGILTSCLLAVAFTVRLHVHGAVMPFAEPLLYSGFNHLNLTHIYMAGVFVASSGAVMDLAMDVAASMQEIVKENPLVSRRELIWCGIRVGRSVVGTMTTTLLLAYSGGYVTLLMAFMAQGIPLGSTLNFIYVAAEILKTLVGSFGLVAVAPFTAVTGGFILSRNR